MIQTAFDLELTFLGTGTSTGVPIIGCACPVCTSTDPRDQRFRASVVVRDGVTDRSFLIDAATELRLQALRAGLTHVDAILMTHAHADHTGGLDDLRRFNELQNQRLPLYASAATAEMLHERYTYAFTEAFPFFGGKPDLDLHLIDGPFDLFGREIIPVPVMHGRLPILGFRIGKLAYVTDAKDIPPDSRDLLRGLDVLVLNALRERPHPTHLSVSEALDVLNDLQPKRAFLTHLSHELGHESGSALLRAGVEIAYDGLTVATGAEQ